MKITIDPAILSDPEIAGYIEEANRFLESKAGNYAEGINGEWGVSRPGKYYFNMGNGSTAYMFLADRKLLADRDRRELVMLQATSRILEFRSKQNMKVIDDVFQRIADEELAHAHG